MSEAPKRVFVDPDSVDEQPEFEHSVQYVRADIFEAYESALLEVREWLEDCSESMYDAPRLKDYLDFMTMIDKALGEASDE